MNTHVEHILGRIDAHASFVFLNAFACAIAQPASQFYHLDALAVSDCAGGFGIAATIGALLLASGSSVAFF